MIHRAPLSAIMAVLFLMALFTPGFMVRAIAVPVPPDPPREFRAAWIATVYNIDWPSRPGLPASQQKAELVRLFDRAAELHLNAIILQIRPACDALYASPYEPWSHFLTGRMGSPPQPFYDPLEFAIEEAHKRGMELHAWFNPVRARTSQRGHISNIHVSRTQPSWVRTHGNYLWLDPGLQEVRNYSVEVILDVVRRYDIDGVHIDDYFYPYPVRGKHTPFQDEVPWAAYQRSGGKLTRSDWRRENINRLVKSIHDGVKSEKDWVKFGVSPFGIWKPGVPAGTTAGLDAVNDLHADSLHWFREGWLDYFSPQLYWNIDSPGQSYPKLLHWWHSQNSLQRHLWPGIASDRIGQDRNAAEIINQIGLNRTSADNGTGSGSILWSFRSVRDNKGGVAEALRRGPFREPALIPASAWMGNGGTPAKPIVAIRLQDAGVTVSWIAGTGSGTTDPRRWLLQSMREGVWSGRVLPAAHRHILFPKAEGPPEWIALRAIDGYGNLGPAAMMRRSREGTTIAYIPASPSGG